MTKTNHTILGVASLFLGTLIFSLQDISVKWIGGDYPVLEIVIIRSLIALPLTLLFFHMEGRSGLPVTRQPRLEVVRGLFLFLSYTTHFMGLAALPLAEIAAIRYSAPLMITALSVFLLGEKVGLHRWLALLVGFAGVLFIVRPGSASFNAGSVFILLSTLFYALSVIVTRRLRTTESSATMAYYSSLVYLAVAFVLAPLAVLVGEIPNAHPSIAFLLHAWSLPTALDLAVMAGLGLIWASGMVMIARAYSLAQTSVIAPFEYITLPIHATWGFVLWHEVPTTATLSGAALTLFSGLYTLYREQKEQAGRFLPGENATKDQQAASQAAQPVATEE